MRCLIESLTKISSGNLSGALQIWSYRPMMESDVNGPCLQEENRKTSANGDLGLSLLAKACVI